MAVLADGDCLGGEGCFDSDVAFEVDFLGVVPDVEGGDGRVMGDLFGDEVCSAVG